MMMTAATTIIEEGELDQLDLSDISDSEFPDTPFKGERIPAASGHAPMATTGKSTYDAGRYHHKRKRGGLDANREALINSPVPDDVIEVPPSPSLSSLSLSPASGRDPDEMEDLDEDELYLRLIALRSMAPELGPERLSPENEPAAPEDPHMIEMIDLLEEADEAAEETAPDIDIIAERPAGAVRTQDTIDLNLVQEKLKRNLQRLKQLETKSSRVPIYSPSQSPVYDHEGPEPPALASGDVTPTYMAELDAQGLVSPVPVESQSKVTSPLSQPPKPSPPKIGLVPMANLISGGDQPTSPVWHPRPANMESVDMELGSDNEAELQFFRDQHDPEKQKDSLFPPSVWAFKSSGKADASGPLLVDLNIPHLAPAPKRTTPKRRRRKTSLAKSEITVVSSEEDEEDLFAQAFSSMGRRKLEKKKQQQSHGVVPPQTDVVESATSDLPSHASLDPIGKEKVPNPLRTLKKRVISRASNNRSTDKIRSALKNPEVLRRHFPNLFKPFIVRCDGESESDDELPSNSERKSVRSHMFDQNLDQFLLESRKKSDGSSSCSSKSHDNSSKTKPPPPPKPVRRNPPGLGKGKEVHQKTTMTPETKAKLMNSSIRHLPKEKQIEYQRLKSYLTKKKKLKEAAMVRVAAKEHQKKVQQAVPGTKETVVQKAPVVPNPLPPAENQNQKKTESTTAAMSISVDENGRNIHLKEGGTDRLNGNQSREVSDDELDKKGGKKLIALEHTLIDARKDLASSLFKMSAELSQYRNEKSSRDEASKLVAELKARLKEAQDLEFKRGGQVENLRLSILNSQQILLNKKSNIQELEKKIVLRADDVLGPGYGYILPDKYSDVIKKKLHAIATNASQIKSDLKTPAFSTNSSKSPQNPTTSSSSLPAMGSSVLAHMGDNLRVPALDPHKQLCPFELSGQCNDARCHFQHVGNITQTET
ncbi:hypothetical protein TCAL_16613 [Tigriopus californicus]|uniref:C3H1-type domain-containing protein n=1 Tax=Tigriopus californicus TaxID=6832 RepID=A0A553NAQ7_TIGCA|nr:uncharacterized protein LOC131888048 [Tigriopus californicus]TRY62522.1 hypothetical protein TCAL_16613 [Tigriopus californicus]